MKTWLALSTLATALLSACLAIGCDKSDSNPAASPTSSTGSGEAAGGGSATKLVVFSQCNNAEPYRAAQNALFKKRWAEVSGVTFEITDAQQDNSKQISQIETALLRKPSLLIVAPNEREPLTAVMGKAMEAGVPVICLERDIVAPNYTTYIRADNLEIGRMVGQFIVDQLTKKHGKPAGTVVEICGLKGVEAEINRQKGAMEVLAKYPDIKVVASPVADWLQSRARERMAEVLSVHKGIDVVYGHNDPMAVGAYLAAKEAGRENEMIFIGVDGLGGEAGGIKSVMDGVLAATFIYPLCADKAVEVGQSLLTGTGTPDKTYVMPSTMITKENAAEMYKKQTN